MYKPSNQGPPASNTRSRAPSPASSHSSHSTSEDEEEQDLTTIETNQEDPVVPAEQNLNFNLPDVHLETPPDDIMAEASLTPQPFTGEGEDPTVWWTSVEQYVAFRKLTDEQFMGLFPLLLRGTAAQWYQNLKDAEKKDKATLKTTFSTAFQQGNAALWARERQLFGKCQGEQSVMQYITNMQTAARGLDLPDEQIIRVIVGGLKPPIRAYVLQQKPATLPELFKHATLAETTVQPDLPAGSILQEIQSLRTEIQKIQTAASSSSNTAASIMPVTGQPHGLHQAPPRYPIRGRGRSPGRGFHHPAAPGPRTTFRTPSHYRGPPPNVNARPQGPTIQGGPCQACGEYTHSRNMCKFKNMVCFFCGLKGHIAAACRKAKLNPR